VISGERQSFHGLDELITFYQCGGGDSSTNEADDDDTILLETPLEGGGPPPPDTRRHGRTNLLHRATREGNVDIVLELTRDSARSLDARNEEGMTATHIAASLGFDEILSLLLEAGAHVNAKDSEGNTPLHVINKGLLKYLIRKMRNVFFNCNCILYSTPA
jgi:tyrosine-protein kinase